MLKLFKTYLALVPAVLILLFLVALRALAYSQGHWADYWQNSTGLLSLLIAEAVPKEILLNVWLNYILSAMLIFFQSSIVLSIFSYYKHRYFKGFLLAWLYALCIHFNAMALWLSPQLIALTFILLAFRNIILINEQKKVRHLIFNQGLLVGLAVLFHLPLVFFSLYFLWALGRSRLQIREIALFFAGMLVPFMYIVAYPILSENILPIDALKQNLSFYDYASSLQNNLMQWEAMLFPAILMLVAIYQSFRFLSGQIKEMKHLFSFIALFLFWILLLSIEKPHYIYFAFPLASYFNLYFNFFQRKMWAEIVHFFLFLSIIVSFMSSL